MNKIQNIFIHKNDFHYLILFYSFILLVLLNTVNCYIIIPLKYISINKFNETTPSDIIKSILAQKLFGIIELGTPKQKVDVRIEFDTNNFYITKNDAFIHKSENTNFNNLNKYNSNSSNSLTILENGILFNDDNLIMTDIAKENFYFNNIKTEIEFCLVKVIEDPSSGGIGLQLYPPSYSNTNSISFLEKIKNKGLSNNYAWSIIYNDKEGNDGYLLLGDYLHNVDNKEKYLKDGKYDGDSLYSEHALSYENIIKTEFYMDELIVYKINDKNQIKERKYLHIKLDYNLGGIVCSNLFQYYLQSNIFTKSNYCYKDKFLLNDKIYYFYYCEKNNFINKKIKDMFPTFLFINHNFNSNFTIIPDDIFIEKGDYIYCLMLFDLSEKNGWILGRPFLKKYQFTFEQESKKIFFYLENNNIIINGVKKSTLVKIIIVLFIIFSILGFFIGRIIYKKHFKKKRKNELDDSFVYNVNNDSKYAKGSKIEMTKKLFNE